MSKVTIHFTNGEKLAFPNLQSEYAEKMLDLLRHTKSKRVAINNGDGTEKIVVFLRAVAWVVAE